MTSDKSGSSVLLRFAMANQLVEAELSAVEKKFDVDLGRAKGAEDAEGNYFPQFDEAVRKEASDMSRHYEVFYCLEKTIRTLISETLKTAEGAGWWNSGRIPPKVHAEVTARIKKETDAAVTLRSDNPIDYTTFGELGELIKANSDLFGGIFSSLRAVERVLANLNMLRGPIAHCSRLAEDEIVRLELSLRDWFRLME